MDIAFIILNYNTYKETIECIQSIESKIDTASFVIVIVDNGSNDNSADLIEKFIINNNKAILLRTNENLGFAKGNNIGIKYANEHYRPKFLVVMNSDTELIQYGLYEKLCEEYNKSNFALLGPMIVTIDGRCDNSPHFIPNKKTIEAELRKFKIEQKFIKFRLFRIYCAIKFLYVIYRLKIKKEFQPIHRYLEFYKYQKQVVLQGSFLVFSQKTFQYIDGFDERTFLYYEEPILYLKLMKYGLTTVYDPNICILHKDGRASKSISKKTRKRLLFINNCYQQSAKVLLDIINGED